MLRRGINPLALFATMFVILCGGPFGMEEIVPLAGPGLFALVLIVVPVIWARRPVMTFMSMAFPIVARTRSGPRYAAVCLSVAATSRFRPLRPTA